MVDEKLDKQINDLQTKNDLLVDKSLLMKDGSEREALVRLIKYNDKQIKKLCENVK